MALQPALLLATHVLNGNHPFWLSILNIFNRDEIDSSRNPLGTTGSMLVSVWEHLKTPALPAEAKILRDAGFDFSRAVAELMLDRVELTIGSGYRGSIGGRPQSSWGVTQILNEGDAALSTIHIEICAEMIWPLLVPTFTQAEKACVSLMVASTILHELAVSCLLPNHGAACAPFPVSVARSFLLTTALLRCSTQPTWPS